MGEKYWCTGFEIGANAGYPEMVLTGATISTAQKRTGANSLLCDPASGANKYADNPIWGTPFNYAGGDRGPATRFYMYLTTATPAAARRFARWTDASGNGYSLRLKTDRKIEMLDNAGAVVETSTDSVPINQWVCIQWTLRMKTLRYSTLWINFVTQFSLYPATTYDLQNFRLGFYNSEAAAVTAYFDDVAIKTCSSGTLYPPAGGHVLTMVPNAVGDYNDWHIYPTGGAFSVVDEIPCNGDTDYVYADDIAQHKDSYGLSNPVASGVTGLGCCPFMVARKEGAAGISVAFGVRSGGSDYLDGYCLPTTGYALYSSFLTVFSLPWSVIDALQAVLEYGYDFATARVTQVLVNVDYQEELPNAPINLAPTGKVLVQKPTYAGDYSQGYASAMGAVQVKVYASDGVTLVWDSGEVAATGARWLVLHGGANLNLGATHKWQARNKDIVGMWGPYCALQTINVNAAPTTPTGCTPTGGESKATLTPTLAWTHNDPDSDAQALAQYEIRRVDTGALVTGYPETSCKAIDTFNRANSATAIGTDETKPTGLVWAVAGGSSPAWGIISNEAYCVNGAGASMAYVNAAVADGTVRCRVKREGTYEVGIVFRSDGTMSNLFRLHFVAPVTQGIRVRLTKVLAATPTTVFTSSDLDIADGGYAEFKVVLSGASITVFVNGANLYSGTITDLQSNTRHGLYYPAASSPSVARWDDFAVLTSAGATPSHVVPGGRLSYGISYQWKVKTSDGSVPGLWGAETAAQLFTCVEAPTAVITHPAVDGEIEPAPSFYVMWTYGGSTAQSKRRIVVYSEDLAELVYDSGEKSGEIHILLIPAGYLRNGLTYKIKVYVWDSGSPPVVGESSWRSFDTQWAPAPTITNVTATPDATGNPHVDLGWDVSGLGADFVKYSIYRRLAGTGVWARIANITTKAIVTYADYNCPLGVAYEFCVRQTQLVTGDEVESDDSNTPSATISVAGAALLHDVTDPTSYVLLKWNPTQDFQTVRQQAETLYWGRTAPVVEIGTGRYRRFSLSYALVAGDAAKLAAINKLLADNHQLCYRDSRGERLFCNFAGEVGTTYRYPGGWQESIPFVESDYAEAL